LFISISIDEVTTLFNGLMICNRIDAVNGHKQTAESLNTAMGNLINAIADHQAVEQRGNFINLQFACDH
jgi:hypothetical protein